ncbi:MAG: hypothetical protein U9R38_06620 [Candidatus Margulisiibacteriota bacterium]|nr:hypothetical protein [Candidatus Margulisiibacteriota bacterium]
MKKWIAAILIIGFFAGQGTFASPLNYSVKELYANPTENSRLIYKIPVEVTLLDVSENANWHKVKISYNVGPFRYEYVGWVQIPIGKTINLASF